MPLTHVHCAMLFVKLAPPLPVALVSVVPLQVCFTTLLASHNVEFTLINQEIPALTAMRVALVVRDRKLLIARSVIKTITCFRMLAI